MIKLEVSTHSGDTSIIEVDDYDAEDITEKRNSNVEAISIGNHSYSRIDLKNIKPVGEINDTEQEDETGGDDDAKDNGS